MMRSEVGSQTASGLAANSTGENKNMLKKLLIANRGEIAVRVIRTAKALGYRTVAVYSEADARAMHVELADEAVCIGPAQVSASYLNSDAILEAARKTGADCIHPGYGFLSENAAFANACKDAGLVFVGPPASAIELMGSKRRSKIAMQEAGVPVVPGYEGDNAIAILEKDVTCALDTLGEQGTPTDPFNIALLEALRNLSPFGEIANKK